MSDNLYRVNASPARSGFTGLVRTRDASWLVAGRGFMEAPCGRREVVDVGAMAKRITALIPHGTWPAGAAWGADAARVRRPGSRDRSRGRSVETQEANPCRSRP